MYHRMASSDFTAAMLAPRETDDPNANRGPALAITTWILLSVSSMIVLARCWAKIKIARTLFFDDALMILALVSFPPSITLKAPS
jgi:hypothetical protein